MALGKNIKIYREARGLTQGELSTLTNEMVSQGAISALEKRDSKSSEFAPMLAAALNVPLDELLKEDYPHTVRKNYVEYGEQNQLKLIPVVGTAQLGDNGFWAEFEYPIGHGDGYISYPSKDKNAYAMRCKGDSMKPRIKHGEYVVIEPCHLPVNGDEVLVKCKQGRVMVKELLYIRDGLVHLASVNESHGKITINQADVDTMHFVAAIVKSSLWTPD